MSTYHPRAMKFLVLFLLGLVWNASCATIAPTRPGSDVLEGSYIITADGGSDYVRKQCDDNKIEYTFRQDLNIISGVSVTLKDNEDIHKISKFTGVKEVFHNHMVMRPRVAFADDMTGVSTAQTELKLDGSGIKIGIIDNGVDFTHPALGGCFGPGCKIAFGFDLVGTGTISNPQPGPTPFETCDGHGTHITGIIGAEDHVKNFTGVAPKATLGMYRINDCNGPTTDDLILKALELADKDQVDIINLSLGDDFKSWSEPPLSTAVSALADKGIVMIVAATNDGASGIFSSGSPDSGINVITVGSVENQKFYVFYLIPSTDSGRKIIYTTTQSTLIYGLQTTAPVKIDLSTDQVAPVNDACAPLTKNLKGVIALIRRGGCTFAQKNFNAQAAGAVGVIFYNNDQTQPFPLSVPGTTIPSAIISLEDGNYLVNQILNNKKKVTVTFPNSTIIVPNQIAGQPSNDSAWGPTYEMDLKPDFLAPGGRILSTFPVALGSYATLSGSSQAAAYASGVSALYLQAKGKTDPKKLRDILQTTAKPVEMRDLQGNDLGMLHSTGKQGGGVVNIFDAVSSNTLISPGKFALNDSVHAKNTQTFTITNTGKTTVKYNIDHLPAASVLGFFDGVLVPQTSLQFNKYFSTVKFSRASVTLRPSQSEKITVTINPPSQLSPSDLGLFSGFIQVKDTSSNKYFTIPYLGLKGDIRDIPVLSPQPDQPFVAKFNGSNPQQLTSQSAVYTFAQNTTGNSDSPSLFYVLGFGTREIIIDCVDANTNKKIGIVFQTFFEGRNGITDPFTQHIFDWFGQIVLEGSTQETFIPNGSYRLILRILKTYGDPTKNNDFATYTSPEIIVAVPGQ
ncbi:18806_t:CDS:2 [Acaulospora morrowiae]|uniref:18806_t:CDS:1 n=1 Tax=Acaulospora morrowiae TaxID=94023 RepID=A0A9N8V531_9GLOM|nr:18806_t:CDS:2 [Acaulospora morrowiae]